MATLLLSPVLVLALAAAAGPRHVARLRQAAPPPASVLVPVPPASEGSKPTHSHYTSSPHPSYPSHSRPHNPVHVLSLMATNGTNRSTGPSIIPKIRNMHPAPKLDYVPTVSVATSASCPGAIRLNQREGDAITVSWTSISAINNEGATKYELQMAPYNPPPPPQPARPHIRLVNRTLNGTLNATMVSDEDDQPSVEEVESPEWRQLHLGIANTFVAEGLKRHRKYMFRVRGVSPKGHSQWSPVAMFSTLSVPSKPHPPYSVCIGPDRVHLKWLPRAVGEGDEMAPITEYVLYVSTLSGRSMEVAWRGDGSDYILRGLSPGKTYSFALETLNKVGASLRSNAVSITTKSDLLESPRLERKQQNSLTLSWASRTACEGDFTYQLMGRIGANVALVPDNDLLFLGDETKFQMKDGLPGKDYTFQVHILRPMEDHKIAYQSLPIVFRTKPIPPEQPDPPRLLHKTDTGMVVQWSTPGANGGTVHQFELQMAVGPDFLNKSEVQSICAYQVVALNAKLNYYCQKVFPHPPIAAWQTVYTGNLTTYLNNSLQPVEMYRWRVRAFNEMGAGEWSDQSRFITPPSSPSQTPMPIASTVEETSITLHWFPPSPHAELVVGYELRMAEGVAGAWKVVFQGMDLTFKVQGVLPDTLYRFGVRAKNSAGWGAWSVEVQAHTPLSTPMRPLPVALVNATDTSLSLEWRLPQRNRMDSSYYRLWMHSLTANSSTPFTIIAKGDNTAHVAKGLKPGGQYGFKVQAFGEMGSSPCSDEVVYSTMAPPPPPVDDLDQRSQLRHQASVLALLGGKANPDEYEEDQ